MEKIFKTKFNVCSYNCKGYNDRKSMFISALFLLYDFILLQEHCLFQNRLHVLNSINSKVGFIGTSAMDENVLLSGRPHGGCAIVWHNDIKHKIEVIDCVSRRLFAIKVFLNKDIHFIIFNVYMPCDKHTHGPELDEFVEILNEITVVVNRFLPEYIIIL